MSTPYEPAPAGPPASQPPSSNLVWAILVTIFCCLPFGIVSIVFAAQVNSKWATGDFAGAQEASAKARRWAIIGAVVGLVVQVLYILLLVGGVLALPTDSQV
ncbi:CD225/dispanin family protein [Aquipuribacter sp. SD81]|uniref:CD225/dispanin family protein n=1 Tax=Aquipuribacter sp. SD81 TaxID=3127703 RepID=UPI00301AC7D2